MKNKEKSRDGTERKGKHSKKLNKHFFNHLNFVSHTEKYFMYTYPLHK